MDSSQVEEGSRYTLPGVWERGWERWEWGTHRTTVTGRDTERLAQTLANTHEKGSNELYRKR